MTRWKKGQILYGQGVWKVRVVEDDGVSLSYAALEGYSPSYDGKTLTASRDLFVDRRLTAKQWDALWTNPKQPPSNSSEPRS